MARDKSKTYVVTAPYVTMTTMTSEGRRVLGFGPGATVPSDVTEEQFDHHLANGLIAAFGEEPAQSVGPTPEVRAQQARDELASARLQVAEAQARLENAQAAHQAAEAEVARQDQADKARGADQAAAQHRVAQRAAGEEPSDAAPRPSSRAAGSKAGAKG